MFVPRKKVPESISYISNPKNIRKTSNFIMFLGGMIKKYWPEMKLGHKNQMDNQYPKKLDMKWF